jgi:hypothetical protein
MAAPLNPSSFVPIGFGALILWRSYYRIRRLVGRQHLSKVRPWVTVTVFPLLAVLLGSAAIAHPTLLAWLGGGIAIGVCLGVYGLRVTKFEKTPQGMFYTPSAHIGVALSVLFLGRVLYRFAQMYGYFGGATQPQSFAASATPLTLLIFGTLAGYYVTYAIGLLRWRFSPDGVTAPSAPE